MLWRMAASPHSLTPRRRPQWECGRQGARWSVPEHRGRCIGVRLCPELGPCSPGRRAVHVAAASRLTDPHIDMVPDESGAKFRRATPRPPPWERGPRAGPCAQRVQSPAPRAPGAAAQVRRSDVQSAWSGLRPLAVDPRATDTASASRDHVIVVDPDGLITVTGAPRARRAPPRAGRGRQGIAGACGRLAPGRLTGAVYGRGGRAGGGCAPTAASAGERGRPHGMTASDCMRVCNLCGSARLRQGLQLCTCLLCVCNDDRTPISNRGGRSDEGVRQAASGRRTGAWRRTRWTRHVRAAASAPAGPAAPPSCRRA